MSMLELQIAAFDELHLLPAQIAQTFTYRPSL